MPAPRPILVALVLGVAIAVAACGSGDDDATPDDAATDTTAPDTDATDPPDPDTTTSTTSTTTTTTTTEPPLPVLDPGDIPDLVATWENAEGEPLDLAEQLIGFPLPVPMPPDTTAYRVQLDMNGRNPDDLWYWEWSYHATTEEPIPEIDIDLDDMGPGAVALREAYDPIMADLGWGHSGTTGSDPSSGGGGPQSVNHVYRSGDATVPIGGVEAVPRSLFVWADEELIFDTGIPGYQIDVDLEIEPGFIPVPFISVLLDDLPIGDEARLVDVSLSSFERPADSFDAEEGLRYFDVTLEWTVGADGAADLRSSLPDEIGGIYQAGEESFFDPGFIEVDEPAVFDNEWTQPVVVLDRYPGSIEIVDDPAAGTATMTLEIRFEANREVLEPLQE